MPEHELLRLLEEEKDALARYCRVAKSFTGAPEIVEAARSLWVEANAALVQYQEDSGS
jgi:hypothetical protein